MSQIPTAAVVLLLLFIGHFILWWVIRHERPEKPKRHLGPLIRGAIVVDGTVAVALVSLVMEDWFSTESLPTATNWWGGSTWGRVIGALLFVASLLYLFWENGRRRERVGTLYYLRYLADWMPDWSIHQLRERALSQVDVRTVTAWMAEPIEGDVDVVDQLVDLSRDFQNSMVDDDATTGYNVAVNALWPAAIALGWDTLRWGRLSLEEVSKLPGSEVSVRTSWEMGEEPPSWSNTQGGLSGDHSCVHESSGTGPDGVIWLSLDVTGPCDPPPWSYRIRRSLSYTEGRGGQYGQLSTEITTDRKRPKRAVKLEGGVFARPIKSSDGDTDTAAVLVHPSAVLRDALDLIRDTLHEYPDSVVLLTARVSKTLAFALGQQLSSPPNLLGGRSRAHGDPGCGNPGCRNLGCCHPMRNLVLLLEDQKDLGGEGSRYVIMRVHPSQPSLAEVRERLSVAAIEARVEGVEAVDLIEIAGSDVTSLNLINLTAHEVAVYEGKRVAVRFPTGAVMARIVEDTTEEGVLSTGRGAVRVRRVAHSAEVADLPEKRPGVGYIVSRFLASQVSRDDLYFPLDEVRDEKGNVLGCRALGQFVGGRDA